MSSKNQTFPAVYRAWNTSSGLPQAGDATNHTINWCADGVNQSTGSPTEIGHGDYCATLTSTNAACNTGVLTGSSSTANVILIGVPYTLEQLPTAAPNTSGGIVTFGTGGGQLNVSGGSAAMIDTAAAQAAQTNVSNLTKAILRTSVTVATTPATTVSTFPITGTATTDVYTGSLLIWTTGNSGPAANAGGSARVITAFNTTTQVATVAPPLDYAPVAGDVAIGINGNKLAALFLNQLNTSTGTITPVDTGTATTAQQTIANISTGSTVVRSNDSLGNALATLSNQTTTNTNITALINQGNGSGFNLSGGSVTAAQNGLATNTSVSSLATNASSYNATSVTFYNTATGAGINVSAGAVTAIQNGLATQALLTTVNTSSANIYAQTNSASYGLSVAFAEQQTIAGIVSATAPYAISANQQATLANQASQAIYAQTNSSSFGLQVAYNLASGAGVNISAGSLTAMAAKILLTSHPINSDTNGAVFISTVSGIGGQYSSSNLVNSPSGGSGRAVTIEQKNVSLAP